MSMSSQCSLCPASLQTCHRLEMLDIDRSHQWSTMHICGGLRP